MRIGGRARPLRSWVVSGTTDLLDEAGIALGAGDVETALARLATPIELEDPPLAHVLLGAIAYMDDRFSKNARGVRAHVLGFTPRR